MEKDSKKIEQLISKNRSNKSIKFVLNHIDEHFTPELIESM